MSFLPGRPPYTTPNFGLPVPGGEEDADGVTGFRELADAVDTVLKSIEDRLPTGGGGGGGGDFELIEDQINAARVDTIEFTAIPQTFRHLRLIVAGRVLAAPSLPGEISMQINGITDNQYSWAQIRGGATQAGESDVPSARLGALTDQSVEDGGPGGSIVCDIPDYCRVPSADVTFIALSAAAGQWGVDQRMTGGQLPGDPINAITLLMDDTAQFEANCRATLYGLR